MDNKVHSFDLLFLSIYFIFELFDPFNIFVKLYHEIFVVIFQALVHFEKTFEVLLGFAVFCFPYFFVSFKLLDSWITFRGQWGDLFFEGIYQLTEMTCYNILASALQVLFWFIGLEIFIHLLFRANKFHFSGFFRTLRYFIEYLPLVIILETGMPIERLR